MVSTPTSMLRHYVKSSGFSAFTPHKPPQEQVESHRSNPQKKNLVLTKAEKLHTPKKKKYVGYVYCYTHSPNNPDLPPNCMLGHRFKLRFNFKGAVIRAYEKLIRIRRSSIRRDFPKSLPPRCQRRSGYQSS